MKDTIAQKVVNKMMEKDYFSQWLGIEVLETGEGHCRLKMKVKKEMLNGFSIAHGGISYSLADSALAFASNGYAKMAVSIETSISHVQKVVEGDDLIAVARERSKTNRIGIYEVEVTNQKNEVVALFKGTVYRTEKDWEV